MAPVGSFLAVDFGNVHTRALLIDLVEGGYTVIAQAQEPTTAGFPNQDIGVGLARAIRQLSQFTGRTLTGSEGKVIQPEQADGSGVGAFIATSSIGRPLRTLIVGLMPDYSVASALRAAAGTYVDIVGIVSLDQALNTEDMLNRIVLARPDLIFVSGGTDGGAEGAVMELAAVVRLAVQLMSGRPPQVLFAGNSALHARLNALFEGTALIVTTANILPSLQAERLEEAQLELGLAFNTFAGLRGAGFSGVAQQSKLGVLPNAQSYAVVTEYLGRLSPPQQGVLVVDIGASTSILSAFANGHVSTSIRTDIGLGASARGLLDSAGIAEVRRWLPFLNSDDEVLDYVMNKTVRPGLIPETLRALYLEHGLLRAALRVMLAAASPGWRPQEIRSTAGQTLHPFERIIGAGAALTGTGRSGLNAMLLLDGLQPHGVTRLQADSAGLIPALGSIARVSPQAVVQLLAGSGIEDLGTAISLSGTPRPGRPAASVRITLESGAVEDHMIEGGGLWVYALPIGAKARLNIRTSRGLHIGGQRRLTLEVAGGTTGLIIDARGRPLPADLPVRTLAAVLPAWYAQASGDPIREVEVSWLETLMTENVSSAQPPARRQRRQRRRASPPAAATVPIAEPAAPEPPAPARERRGLRRIGSKEAPPPPEVLSEDDLRNLLS
jgi:hypothetical protein